MRNLVGSQVWTSLTYRQKLGFRIGWAGDFLLDKALNIKRRHWLQAVYLYAALPMLRLRNLLTHGKWE
jgi:hypothetical protein